MALVMAYQSTPGGSYTLFDPAAFGVQNVFLAFSDAKPAALKFDLTASQESMPLGLNYFIRFWDSAGTTPDGAAQSETNPAFEGFIHEIQPAESNRLQYVAYDPTMRVASDVYVFSTAWNASGGPGLMPTPADTAVPRVIFNNTIFNDVDYAFERASQQSVGDIIATVMNDATYPLNWFNAAPDPAGTIPYIPADLLSFTYQPQAKVVSTNESLRQFIDRLTQSHYPEYAFLWTPGTRLWHWYSRLTAPAETVTLNKPDMAFTSGHTTTVLSMELHRSLEGRFPAVKFYGPDTAGPVEIFSTLDGTLTPIGPYVVLENYVDSGGIGTVIQYSAFQIVDEAKRRGAKFFPTTALIRENDYFQVGTRSPKLEVTFDSGNTWLGVESIWFDFQAGTAVVPEGVYIYYWSDHELEAGSTRHFWKPNGYRLVWAPYSDPISVRYPDAGFDGTSYTVAGQTSVYTQYDEMLAVGYNRVGLPVTTTSRLTQFLLLAQSIWRAKKDIVYAGGMLLEGIIWDFCRLNKCVNLAAVDENGSTITTGWEAIRAIVTDVEYDFSEMTTHITFSQDALTQWGDSIDLLKERLKIGDNVEMRQQLTGYNVMSHADSKYSNKGAGYNYVSGIVYNLDHFYYDPNTGNSDRGITNQGME